MPIYEYRCEKCGEEFEKRVARVSDAGSVLCPSCGAKPTQKLSTFSAVTGDSESASAPSCPSAACCPNRGLCGVN